MLLALMDEAYTGSTIEDGAGDSESEDSSSIDVDNPLFLEILKDENDGLAVCSPFILLSASLLLLTSAILQNLKDNVWKSFTKTKM